MKIDLGPVKRLLESKTCPDHRERPKVTITGDKHQHTCCCEKFKASLSKLAEKGIGDGSKKAVEKEMENIFKKLR